MSLIFEIDSCTAEILRIMCQLSAPVSADDIGQRVGISARSVNYRIHQVKPWLEDNGITIRIKTNSGMKIQASQENIDKLLNNLGQVIFYSKERRLYLIIFNLLTQDKPLNLSFFEEIFSISRSTAIKEITQAKEWLNRYNVEVNSKPNFGYWVEGLEADIRESIFKCILKGAHEFKQQDELMEYCFSGKTKKNQYHSFVGEIDAYLREINFYYLNNILNTILDIHITDRNNYRLILRLAILITRIKRGGKIGLICPGLGDFKQKNEYYWVEFVTKRICKYYEITLGLEEVSYLIKYFIDAQSRRPIEQDTFDPQDLAGNGKELIESVESFLCQISKRMHPSLILDSELKLNLVLHLNSLYYRSSFEFPEENPITKEIRQDYPRVYYLVSQCIQDCGFSFLSDNPDEIGYLTIHIAAALEKLHYQKRNNKTILLVCNTGAASALLLKTKIQSEFPEIVIEDVISYKELLRRKKFSGIDFIISTIPFQLIGAPPVLVVDVMFREKDIDNLNKTFYKETGADCKLPKISIPDGPPLNKLLDENMVALQKEASDWGQATELAGSILLENQIIEKRYIQSMKEVIREFGPFMVAWPGVALLHASFAAGAKKLGMSLLTLASPVIFGHPENDPVDIVIALSIPVDCSIPLALDQLNSMLLSEREKNNIRKATDPIAVMKQIRLFCTKATL